MAHKTLIGGTAYEISGGKTLVNGTAYSIDKGKTLVGGTAYEVGFAPKIPVVTIKGNVANETTAKNYFSLTVDGQPYMANCGTVELTVPTGTIVDCSVSTNYMMGAKIILGQSINSGTILASAEKSATGEKLSHSFEIVGDTTITLGSVTFSYFYILITET